MTEVYRLIGTNKISTTAYHPQTDGLTERFHWTLLDMLAKTAKKNIKDWDLHLPYVLFSYRVAQQESTKASPFELLYGRDAKLPNDLMEPPGDEDCPTPEGYLTEVRTRMSEAWTTARDLIRKAQEKQKSQYDQREVPLKFKEGDLVYLFQPAKLAGKTRKLERPYEGPYQIMDAGGTCAKIEKIGRGRKKTLRVAWD